jgi:hypothetical protein
MDPKKPFLWGNLTEPGVSSFVPFFRQVPSRPWVEPDAALYHREMGESLTLTVIKTLLLDANVTGI